MHGPRDAMRHMSEQMGWLGQLLGEDFWANVRAAAEAGVGAPGTPADRAPAPLYPPIDLYVTPGEVVLSAAIPGLVRPEQVAVSLAGPAELLLEGFVPPDQTMDLPLHRERFTGYYVRSVGLPVPVDVVGARASCVDGILEIRLARSATGAPGQDIQVLHVPGGPHPAPPVQNGG